MASTAIWMFSRFVDAQVLFSWEDDSLREGRFKWNKSGNRHQSRLNITEWYKDCNFNLTEHSLSHFYRSWVISPDVLFSATCLELGKPLSLFPMAFNLGSFQHDNGMTSWLAHLSTSKACLGHDSKIQCGALATDKCMNPVNGGHPLIELTTMATAWCQSRLGLLQSIEFLRRQPLLKLIKNHSWASLNIISNHHNSS